MVSACSWLDDGKAGHCTPAMAISDTTATTTATAAAKSHLAQAGQCVTHDQIGSLRKMLRGMCRNTIIT